MVEVNNKSVKRNKLSNDKSNYKMVEVYKSEKVEFEEERKKLEVEKDSWRQKSQGTLVATSTPTGNSFMMQTESYIC